MRERYESVETKALAAQLGRTVATIQKRAELLGLKKDPKFQAETRFKPGERPQAHRPIGSTHKFGEGYTYIKTAEGFKPLHHVTWKQAHGEYPPPGAVVRFKDGNRHCVPENLEMITRREQLAEHSVNNMPPELRELVQLKGTITFLMNRRKCE